MASKTTLALAIALSLALLCLGSVALIFRCWVQRNKAFRSRRDASLELEKAQKQLSAFPAVGDHKLTPYMFERGEVIWQYSAFAVALSAYVRKWVLHSKPPIPEKHSAA
ncbi:hypothetical protein IFR05_007318 [Cadophora sp. M221]|nr:hypothetical protein IFR05_007318 [Cadophora sp. M221]